MSKNTALTNGAPLIIEDLDLSAIGLYSKKDPNVPEEDYFPAEEKIGSLGIGYWARKSDEGKKWHTFKDTELKLHKTFNKKD